MTYPLTGWSGTDVPIPAFNEGRSQTDALSLGASYMYEDWGYVDYNTQTRTDWTAPASRNGLGSMTDGRTEIMHETQTGAVLVIVRSAAVDANENKRFMYRCDGTTKAFYDPLADESYPPVLWCGADGADGVSGTHAAKVQALGDSNFLNFHDGTQDAILFAEYSTNGVVYNLAIWKSIDDGITWTEFWRINTATPENFRHCHGIHQIPYSGNILVCLGDGGNDNKMSSMIQGPKDADWTQLNGMDSDEVKTWIELSAQQTAGWRILQSTATTQTYRAVDVEFNLGYIYWYTDAGSDYIDDQGIFRIAHNFSDSAFRVLKPYHATSNTTINGTVGGAMVKDPTTQTIVVIDNVKSDNGTNKSRFYAIRNSYIAVEFGYFELEPATRQPVQRQNCWRSAVGSDGALWFAGTYAQYNADGSSECISISLSGTHSGGPVRLNEGPTV